MTSAQRQGGEVFTREIGMQLDSLDHLVLTVRDLEASIAFYERALGMRVVRPERGPAALHYGTQKIHLHGAGHEFNPKSVHPTPGSGDLCFLTSTPVDDWIPHLAGVGATVELGPVPRQGAQGPIRSIYLRDPDGNLIEIANPVQPA